MPKKPTSKKAKTSKGQPPRRLAAMAGYAPERPQRIAYTQRTDNEGFEVPNGEIYKLACCDCGLVHQIVIVAPGLKKGTPLGMAAKRDNRATAARRRRRAHTVTTHAPGADEPPLK